MQQIYLLKLVTMNVSEFELVQFLGLILYISYFFLNSPNRFSSGDRVIDVGSEWRTFSNEKALKDPSRVGDAQNPLLNGGDLTTMISKVRRPSLKMSLDVCILF